MANKNFDWEGYYKNEIIKKGGPRKYVQLKSFEKKELIDAIAKYSLDNKRVLEAACGTAAISVYLSFLGFDVYGVDIGNKMLKIGKELSSSYGSKVKFSRGDITKLPFPDKFFDVVFSHGVLEHFSDEEIVKIINEELRVGKTVIVSIPSEVIPKENKVSGDERFMNAKDWSKILKNTNGFITEKFGYFFQSKIHYFIDRIFKNSMISKAPYIAFILKE